MQVRTEEPSRGPTGALHSVVGGPAVEQAKLVGEGWPGIRVETIEDTGHALFVDKPEEFNRVLEEFIA